MAKKKQQLEVTFYGTRGGQPAPSRDYDNFRTSKYGGNTTSLVIQYDNKYSFIDAGTGISVASARLLEEGIGTKENPLQANLYLTHFHSDHTDGMLFCGLMIPPHNTFNIFGRDTKENIERILRENQKEPHFPLAYSQQSAKDDQSGRPAFQSTRNHHNIYETPPTNGLLQVTATPTCHPGGCIAYRFNTPTGESLVFGGDHEFGIDREIDLNLGFFCKEVDTLIMDCQYTPSEYDPEKFEGEGVSHIGWGHSHYGDVIDFALESKTKKLILTHHDRERSDENADNLFHEAQTYLHKKQGSQGELEMVMAKEGDTHII